MKEKDDIDRKLIRIIDYTKKKERHKAINDIDMDIDIGYTIQHNTWGIGIIKDIMPVSNDRELRVEFNNGDKKSLLLSLAPIEIIKKNKIV